DRRRARADELSRGGRDRQGVTPHALRVAGEALVTPVAPLAAALALFGAFVAVLGHNPLEVYALIYRGAFASAFSWQNTLARAAPLVLTGLCAALPGGAGLMV